MQRVTQEIKTLVSCIATKLELHKESLQVVYRYICALNCARSDATARGETLNHRDNTVHSPDQAMGDRAKQFMIEYSSTDSFNLVEGAITLEQVNANIQGARLAHCVWEWAKTIQWPKEEIDNPPMATNLFHSTLMQYENMSLSQKFQLIDVEYIIFYYP